MSETAIRQKIFETITGQPGIAVPSHASATLGMVHKYERWSNDWNKFLALFKDPVTGRIFGWEIRRASMPAEKLSNMEQQNTHIYQIKGYLAVQDSEQTELMFNLKIEELRGLFKGNHTLDDTCLDAGAISVDVIDERMFGTVLCHYAELRMPVAEIV